MNKLEIVREHVISLHPNVIKYVGMLSTYNKISRIIDYIFLYKLDTISKEGFSKRFFLKFL